MKPPPPPASFRERNTCRLCDSKDLAKMIPLSPLPVASPNVGGGSTITETASADVWQCRSCGFLQLNTIVDPAFHYRNFRYVTGISVGLREHFRVLVEGLQGAGEINPGSFVLDIGSNDGSLLAHAVRHGARVLGIDPAEKIAQEATQGGIPTIAEFFDEKMAERLAAEYGRANVVICNNTLANIDGLLGVLAGIRAVMKPDGILVIETQYAMDMVESVLLDVIYHEHISYFAVQPMRTFLAAHGFELIDAERIAPKGGSIRFHAQLKSGGRTINARVDDMVAVEHGSGLYGPELFERFNARVAKLGAEIRSRLAASKQTTGRALAFGSSVGCAALVQYFDLGEYLDAVFDDMPLTNFIRTRSRNLPVLAGSQLANEPATDVVILAWRYTAEVAARHGDFVKEGGRFFRALPDLAYAAPTP